MCYHHVTISAELRCLPFMMNFAEKLQEKCQQHYILQKKYQSSTFNKCLFSNQWRMVFNNCDYDYNQAALLATSYVANEVHWIRLAFVSHRVLLCHVWYKKRSEKALHLAAVLFHFSLCFKVIMYQATYQCWQYSVLIDKGMMIVQFMLWIP